jgi:DNA repair exonuclease SbcCD ATPase subunit
MNPVYKDLENRRDEIKKGVEELFRINMKITDWDVPEVDDAKAATALLEIMQEALDEIKAAVRSGKYDNY